MKALTLSSALALALLGSPALAPAAGDPPPLADPVLGIELPPAPGPGYVWVPGHLEANYAQQRWTYVSPGWVLPPIPGGRFVPGRWARSANEYGWNPGHWEAYPGNRRGAEQPAAMRVTHGPPPQVIEPVHAAPGAGYAWIPGYWWWGGKGAGWVWAPGYFVPLPRPHAAWAAARWEPADDGGWRFRPGYWRR